ncbi:MAG: biosynthetic arginine decarboxylase [Opitutae bacterium]|nr:biosynthetic arginine decarboxylase [Opitutae bacterium]
MKKSQPISWTPAEAEEYYGIKRWGANLLSVDGEGFLNVHPMGDERRIRITDIVKEAKSMGLRPPMTIRVQDVLRSRVIQLNKAFRAAIDDENYHGRYQGVFPIKVNQLRKVVEEILDAGDEYDYGLEAGSKPELLVALALLENKKALLICNGYKDEEYIRLALIGRRLGKRTVIVVEQLAEVDQIIRIASEMDAEPVIGFRVKLTTNGEGKWAKSTGESAKFGLTPGEIILAAKKLKRARRTTALQLLHFHIGSQVPNILTIKKAVTEAARFYCELVEMGFPMGHLDVGGGLGIDYDGSRSNYESSMNYSMEVYARDVVANIKAVCDDADVPHPMITSESGRAIVAPHAILITEAVGRIGSADDSEIPLVTRKKEQIVKELEEIYNNAGRYGLLERYHDAGQKREEAHSLFQHGYLNLENRAEADRIYWEICRQIQKEIPSLKGNIPEELADIDAMLAEQYVCNFSIFQSLLDCWAIKQLFPIAPIQRLTEKPTVPATLVDITCDSDGKISEFVDFEDVKNALDLHELRPGEPYYLGIFLVGAYQDIIGDLHNLFGRVDEVHVFLEDDEEDGFYIEEALPGYSVDKILDMIQYKADDLCRMMKKQMDRATKAGKVRPRERISMLALYEELIKGRSYLVSSRKKRRVAKKSPAKRAEAPSAANPPPPAATDAQEGNPA